MECNSDYGDYSEILGDLARIIKQVKPKKVPDGKEFVAKILRTNLSSIYTLVQSHYMNGLSGVASVLYNELSGLAGSAMIRRVSKVLRGSAGNPRGMRGGASGSRSDPSPASQGGFPPNQRRGAFGGRGNFNRFNNRGRGGNVGNNNNNNGPRAPMVCFNCREPGHRYQDCNVARRGR